MTIEHDQMILAKDRTYSLDCYKTQLNNNVLVVGASGSGKTRSIVTPNLLQVSGSYIISDPKGSLYDKYKTYMEAHGYAVKLLDFVTPERSEGYSFFPYIHSSLDIVKIAHMLMHSGDDGANRTLDPFWDDAGQLLLQAIIGYLHEFRPVKEQNFRSIQKLIDAAMTCGDMENNLSPLDRIFDDVAKLHPDSFASNCYKKYRVAADKTLRSILISVNAKLVAMTSPEIIQLTSRDEMNISEIGQRKQVVFVVVSDSDRSMDGLVNLFFTQAMNELCLYADTQCKDCSLPVPVRFILDDFATNCKIADFPKKIASIRSRNISTMLIVQAESQLEAGYGRDGRTIIGNCDTYVYLGCNDYDTACAVARRVDVPTKKILNMPVGSNWIFRRGSEPVYGENFPLNTLLQEKGLEV